MTMDSFDVRHLLGSDSEKKKKSEPGSRLDGSLDEQRYGELRERTRARNEEEQNQRKRARIEREEEQRRESEAAARREEEERPFAVPYDVPVGVTEVPRTEKQHNVIFCTVQFVLQKGPNFLAQIEQRQGSDPLFSFCRADDPLHGYFRYLLRAAEHGTLDPSASFWQDLPVVSATALNAEALHKLVIDRYVAVVKEFGPPVSHKIAAMAASLDKHGTLDFLLPSHPLNTYYLEKSGTIVVPHSSGLVATSETESSVEQAKAERRKRALELLKTI